MPPRLVQEKPVDPMLLQHMEGLRSMQDKYKVLSQEHEQLARDVQAMNEYP